MVQAELKSGFCREGSWPWAVVLPESFPACLWRNGDSLQLHSLTWPWDGTDRPSGGGVLVRPLHTLCRFKIKSCRTLKCLLVPFSCKISKSTFGILVFFFFFLDFWRLRIPNKILWMLLMFMGVRFFTSLFYLFRVYWYYFTVALILEASSPDVWPITNDACKLSC